MDSDARRPETGRMMASFALSVGLNLAALALVGRYWTTHNVRRAVPRPAAVAIKLVELPKPEPPTPAAPQPKLQAAPPKPAMPAARSATMQAAAHGAQTAFIRRMAAAPRALTPAPQPAASGAPIPISQIPVPYAPPLPKMPAAKPVPVAPVFVPKKAAPAASHAVASKPKPAPPVQPAEPIKPAPTGTVPVPPVPAAPGPSVAKAPPASAESSGTPAGSPESNSGGTPEPAQGSGNGAGGSGASGPGAGSSEAEGNGAGGSHEGGNGTGDDGGPFGIGTGLGAGEGPRHIVYLLDISLSMPTRIERAKEELHDALAGLGRDESFDIIAFGGNTQPFEDHLVPVTHGAIAKANAFLDTLQLREGTNLERAITEAVRMDGVNVVVVITDGVPTVGETDFKKLARRIRERNAAHARIYTIGLVGKDPDGHDDTFEATRLLQQIARDSGGEFKLVSLGEAMM